MGVGRSTRVSTGEEGTLRDEEPMGEEGSPEGEGPTEDGIIILVEGGVRESGSRSRQLFFGVQTSGNSTSVIVPESDTSGEAGASWDGSGGSSRRTNERAGDAATVSGSIWVECSLVGKMGAAERMGEVGGVMGVGTTDRVRGMEKDILWEGPSVNGEGEIGITAGLSGGGIVRGASTCTGFFVAREDNSCSYFFTAPSRSDITPCRWLTSAT